MSECVFCRIVNGELPAEKIFENEKYLVFSDVNPQAPVHYLVIPKEHITDLMAVKNPAMLGEIFSIVQDVAKKEGLEQKGFRVVNNCGDEGGQTVDHLHFHILGGRFMEWPPG